MAERVSTWRSKPSQEVVDLLQQVGIVQLFLVQRPGPTSFVVREEGSEVKRKVQIGSRISCSCSPVGANGTCKELCLHILFLMVKVLRVPISNPLLWQLSLSDRELEEVLRCAMQPERPPQEAAKGKPSADKTPAGQVKRREIDEEDPCPICYEDMVGQDLDNLVWCRFGCGRNVHGKCMGVWMEHQVQSLGKELTCPLCRSEWGEFKWRPPPPKRKAREERKDVHYGTHCGACKKAPLVGKRFRCLICADFDLCDGCFTGGHHPQHPFAVKDTPKSFGAPAERPAMMPTAMPIARMTVQTGSGATAGPSGLTSPRHGNSHVHLGQRTLSQLHIHDTNSGSCPQGGGNSSGGEGEVHGEVEAAVERRASGSGAAGSGGPTVGGSNGRDALAVGVVGQQQQPIRPGGGGGQATAARHPIRGTTVARAGAAGRAVPEEHICPPTLEARLAAQRRPLLAVEGLTVGPGGTTAASGQGPAPDWSDMLVRRAALGQPSRPVLVRRTRSTVHDKPSVEGPGPGATNGELNLGLEGVPLNAGGERSIHGEAAGPGPASMAAGGCRQQATSNMPARHPPRPSQHPPRPGMSARPQPQPHAGAAAWAHPSAAGGSSAVMVPAPPPDLILQGHVVLHGEGTSPGPVGRPPPAPQAPLTNGATGAHGTLVQQPSVGVRCRGPPPRYMPPPEHQQPGLRRTHSAGPQGLAVTARSMAPHPLTPETPAPVHPPAMPALLVSLHANIANGGGPYGPAPYGNEIYGGAIQYDDNVLMAFTHHIPGPAASSFCEGLDSGGRRMLEDEQVGENSEWSGGSDGEQSDEQEEFPRGPASPSIHLFSSRPNTVPSELVSDLYGESRDMSRSLSHSHSFTASPSARRSSRFGPSLSRSGLPVVARFTPNTFEGGGSHATEAAAVPITPCGRAGARFGLGSSGGVRDVARDSVLLGSVRVDAVDDWMDSLRQRASREGGASPGHSCNGYAPELSPRATPLDASLSSSPLNDSVNVGATGALLTSSLAGPGVRTVNASSSGDDTSETLATTRGEPFMALSASIEDTLSAFMVEQRMAGNPPLFKAEQSEVTLNTFANPVFNRPYTLDMSFQ